MHIFRIKDVAIELSQGGLLLWITFRIKNYCLFRRFDVTIWRTQKDKTAAYKSRTRAAKPKVLLSAQRCLHHNGPYVFSPTSLLLQPL